MTARPRALGGAGRCEQPLDRVERAVGVVGGERLLVRPAVANVPEFEDEVAVGARQLVAERFVPAISHHPQLERRVIERRLAGKVALPPRSRSGSMHPSFSAKCYVYVRVY